MGLRLLSGAAAVALVCFSGGCGGSDGAASGGGGSVLTEPPDAVERPRADSPAASADLELLSGPRETLRFGQPATLAARLTDSDGAPVGDAPVSFALMGRAQDASLAQLEAYTDDDGRVENVLMAGEAVATFRVRISAPGAGDLYVEVRISNAGFGTLLVDAPYEGARAVEERSVSALAMMACQEAERMAGDPMATLTRKTGDAPAEFLALPADVAYAVLVSATGEDGTVVARGCVDGVKLGADDQVRIEVPLEDEPLVPGGDYVSTWTLDARGPARSVARVLRDAAEATILGDATTPTTAVAEAGFLLDTLEGALASEELQKIAGVPSLATNLKNARQDPGAISLDESLAAQLGLEGTGPRTAVTRLGDLIGMHFERVELDGELTLEAADAGSDTLTVRWSLGSWTSPASSEGGTALSVDVSELSDTVVTDTRFEPERDVLVISRLTLPSGFGALSAEVVRRSVSLTEGDSGDEIRELAGCGTLGEWLSTLSFYTDSCTTACLQAVCERVITRVVGAGDEALRELDDTRPTLTLEGELELGDEDGNLLVEQMLSASLAGQWDLPDTSDAGTEAEALVGEANATADTGSGGGNTAAGSDAP